MAGRHVQRIVVGIDFSPMSKQVLRETIHHVGTGGAELHVLFVATSSDVIDQWQLDLKVLIDDLRAVAEKRKPAWKLSLIHI